MSTVVEELSAVAARAGDPIAWSSGRQAKVAYQSLEVRCNRSKPSRHIRYGRYHLRLSALRPLIELPVLPSPLLCKLPLHPEPLLNLETLESDSLLELGPLTSDPLVPLLSVPPLLSLLCLSSI